MQFNTNAERREKIVSLKNQKCLLSLDVSILFFKCSLHFLSLTKGLSHFELMQWQTRVSHEDDLCPYASILI